MAAEKPFVSDEVLEASRSTGSMSVFLSQDGWARSRIAAAFRAKSDEITDEQIDAAKDKDSDHHGYPALRELFYGVKVNP